MQHRMKTHQLQPEQIDELLSQASTASLATVNADGTPYVTPVHFVYYQDAIYFHGLPAGQKLNNLQANPRVSMAVYQMDSLLLDPANDPCETNTKYQSIIIQGRAAMVENIEAKQTVLTQIVAKYTPVLKAVPLPPQMVEQTAVIKITIEQITGKYYPA